MRMIPLALTIAGSDSCGGAGIQADLKTFAALGVHGMSAITAITAQNTMVVTDIQDIDPKIVKAQIEAVADDVGVDAAKTGMLHTSEIIKVVADEVKKYKFPLIVDPVMIAKSGAVLLKSEATHALIKEILPLATVLTPNAMEAEVLSNMKINTLQDGEKAAIEISTLGPKAVIVKGGHIFHKDRAIDILYSEGKIHTFEAERFETKTTHGTGCSFASAITAELAKGKSIIEAVGIAKEFVNRAIYHGLSIGKGHGPLNPMANLYNDAEKYVVLQDVKAAVALLESHPKIASLAPESQMNIGMALSYALDHRDVAAVLGRIVRVEEAVKASGCPDFGVSRHVARTILAVRRHDPSIRAGMNMRFSEELVKICERLGLVVSFYDRREEPPDIKAKEGMTTIWGAEEAIKRVGRVPDIIYHDGDWGKEPMISILGKSAVEVAKIAVQIASHSSS